MCVYCSNICNTIIFNYEVKPCISHKDTKMSVLQVNKFYQQQITWLRTIWCWHVQRPNSWTKSRKKAEEFSSLLFTVTYTALPWDFYFFKLTQPPTVSSVQLLKAVKEKGAIPDSKPYPLALWFKKSIQKPQVWELSRLCPETSTKLYVHEFVMNLPTGLENS